jgi:hypothetical protein
LQTRLLKHVLDIALHPLDVQTRWESCWLNLVNWRYLLLHLGHLLHFCMNLRLFIIIFGCSETLSSIAVAFIFVHISTWTVICITLSVDCWLILKIVLSMGIITIRLLVSPAIRLCVVWFLKSLVLFVSAVISLTLSLTLYLLFIIWLL